MNKYVEELTLQEQRDEMSEMLENGEGFIASHESLVEYVDSFASKVRADFVELLSKRLWEDCHKDYSEVMKVVLKVEEEAKEKKV